MKCMLLGVPNIDQLSTYSQKQKKISKIKINKKKNQISQIARTFFNFFQNLRKRYFSPPRADKCIVKISSSHENKQNILAIYLRQATLNEMYDNENIKFANLVKRNFIAGFFQ